MAVRPSSSEGTPPLRGLILGPSEDHPAEERRGSTELAEDASGRCDQVRTQADVDPFGLIALADLPDVTLGPEDRLWWDIVLAEHVTLLAGHPDAGKTTLLRSIVGAISTGREFLGWSGPAGGAPCVILDYETPGIDRKPRWRAVFGEAIEDVTNVVVSRETPFLNDVGADGVSALLRSYNAKLLVVDTLARAFNVESENDNATMSRVIGLLKKVAASGVAVVVVTHVTKNRSVSLHSLRGASSIVAAADIVVGLRKEREDGAGSARKGSPKVELDDEEDDDENTAYVLQVLKHRSFAASSMRIYRTGDLSFRAASGSESADTRARSVCAVELIVREAGPEGIKTEAVVKGAKEQGIAKRTAKGALRTLLDEKILRKPEHGLYVHREHRNAAQGEAG